MLGLLEIKEKLKNFYADHEMVLAPVLKFLAAFLAMVLIKFNVGYLAVLNMWIVVLGASVLFAFLPWAVDIVCMGVIIVVNICSLSLELGLLIGITMLIMIIFFFRFTPKQGAFLVIIPLAFFLKIPYIIPIAAGLVATPVAIVSVSCGTIIFFMLHAISTNISVIGNITDSKISGDGINTIINMIGNNPEMILTLIAFAVTIVVVYLVKRASINNSWIIAIVSGAILDFAIILVGIIILNIETSVVWLIIGTIISLILAYILQFFVFSVDYSRTEHTQFEDDEYYYYVKAVPKINVSAPEMNVKRINAQRKKKIIGKTGNKKRK